MSTILAAVFALVRTFIKNHAEEIFACDFLVQYTARFDVVYVFVVMQIASRRVVHCNVTASPTLRWVKQQIRILAPFGSGPRFLIHDNDGIFGQLGSQPRRVGATRARRFRCHLDRWLSEVMGIERSRFRLVALPVLGGVQHDYRLAA